MALPPPNTQSGRTLIYDGLAQNDVDMAHHRLLNLDSSNLPPFGMPPPIHPPANQWLHDFDMTDPATWHSTRPQFEDIGPDSGTLTLAQQSRISQVGLIRTGQWQGTPLLPDRVPSLEFIRSPQGNVNLNFKRLTNVANPVDPGDAINLGFLDSMLQGLRPKEAVRCATTMNIVLSGLVPIDGVTDLQDGDRVLVKNQNTIYDNGIYRANAIGAWPREPDFDGVPDDEELLSAYVFVLEGTLNAFTAWVQKTPSPVMLVSDTDPQQPHAPRFILFSNVSSSVVVAGAGLARDGDILNVGGTPGRIAVNPDNVDIDPAYAGQTSITTLGTITSGGWHGNVIASEFGGTGNNNQGFGIHLGGDFSVQNPSLVTGAGLVLQVNGFCIVTVPPGGTLATLEQPETFLNKRITRRVIKISSNAQPAINVDNLDVFCVTNLSESITSMTNNLTGTPTDRQELEIWIKDSGVGPVKTITWGTKWMASPDLPLPAGTTNLMTLFLKFVYSVEFAKWVLVQKLDKIS